MSAWQKNRAAEEIEEYRLKKSDGAGSWPLQDGQTLVDDAGYRRTNWDLAL